MPSDNKKNNNIGQDIVEALTEGLAAGDFSKLNSAMSKSVDAIIDSVGDSLEKIGNIETGPNVKKLSEYSASKGKKAMNKSATQLRQEQLEAERKKRLEELARDRASRAERRADRSMSVGGKPIAVKSAKSIANAMSVPFNTVGDVSGVLHKVFGGITTGIAGLCTIGALVSSIAVAAPTAGLIVGSLFTISGIGMIRAGASQSNRLKRVARYLQLADNQPYIEIDKMAKAVNKSEKYVLRDLKGMFKRGFFPQGHFDTKYKNFMMTDEVYKQYLETENTARLLEESHSKEIIDTTAYEVVDGLSEEQRNELNAMVNEGNSCVDRLHELNDSIPGEVISNKLEKLEKILKEIFICVKVHPEQMGRMHELMEYYLPTTIKLVEAYDEYDKVTVKGDNIVSAMNDIEKTIDTINSALEKLLNNLFKDSVWDVTTDAKVLQNMLVQKGLANNMKE